MKMRVCQPIQSTARPTWKRNAAFTLLETLIGAFILVIVFGSLMVTMSYGFAVIRASRESLRATQIILERMEGIRLYNWNQLVSSNMIGTNVNFSGFFYPPALGITNGDTVYHLNMIVTQCHLEPHAQLRRQHAAGHRQPLVEFGRDNAPAQHVHLRLPKRRGELRVHPLTRMTARPSPIPVPGA